MKYDIFENGDFLSSNEFKNKKSPLNKILEDDGKDNNSNNDNNNDNNDDSKKINGEYINEVIEILIEFINNEKFKFNINFKKLIKSNRNNFKLKLSDEKHIESYNPIIFLFNIFYFFHKNNIDITNINNVKKILTTINSKESNKKYSTKKITINSYDKLLKSIDDSSLEYIKNNKNTISKAVENSLNDKSFISILEYNKNVNECFIDIKSELDNIFNNVFKSELTNYNNNFEWAFSKLDNCYNHIEEITSLSENIIKIINNISYNKIREDLKLLYDIQDDNILTNEYIYNFFINVNTFFEIKSDDFYFDEYINSNEIIYHYLNEDKELLDRFKIYQREKNNLNSNIHDIIKFILKLYNSINLEEFNNIVSFFRGYNILSNFKTSSKFKDFINKEKENDKYFNEILNKLTQLYEFLKNYLNEDPEIFNKILKSNSIIKEYDNLNIKDIEKTFYYTIDNISGLNKLDERFQMFNEMSKIIQNYDDIEDYMGKILVNKFKSISKVGLNKIFKGGFKSITSMFTDVVSEIEKSMGLDGNFISSIKGVKLSDYIDLSSSEIKIENKGFYTSKIYLIDEMDKIGEQNLNFLVDNSNKTEDLSNILHNIENDVNIKNINGVNYDLNDYEIPFFRTNKSLSKKKGNRVLFYTNGIKNNSLFELFFEEGKTFDYLICEYEKLNKINKRVFAILSYNNKQFRVPINTFRLITQSDLDILQYIYSSNLPMYKFMSKNIKNFSFLDKWNKVNLRTDGKFLNNKIALNKFILSLDKINKIDSYKKNNINKFNI